MFLLLPRSWITLVPMLLFFGRLGQDLPAFPGQAVGLPACYEVGGRLLPGPMDLPDYQRPSAAGEPLHNLPANPRRGAMWKIVPLLVLVAVSETAVAISFGPNGLPSIH